ncbi:MAG: type II toxin-antitoxin system HipA family toxin [Alphaproteobacteria bacterium]|nr:type II toxin-antitoxin system HipA family toxin [Alphaproteobacteria bacterium]MBP7904471.1 type II toxin-antitoxin system HipA family toxin [Alphaproteobacteria bacterium]
MTRLLRVSMNERPIGILTLLPSGGVFFAFDEAYLNDFHRPVLSQSFYRPSGEVIPESKSSAGKLPAFFSNLLPEGHMREYLAQRGGINPANEFRLIELLGQDLSGAVILTPLEGAQVEALSPADGETDKDHHPLRFSLAGVQLKFSAIIERDGGLTIPATGMGGDWIVKLPAQNYAHVPENEYAMMDLAAQIGIPVPETRLVPLSEIANLPDMGHLAGKRALAVKRFDRTPKGRRIHIEDFAQVYNIRPERKYEGVSYGNLAGMVWSLTGEVGLRDFIRRLTFCIVIGNGDMHLKNWSFIYEDARTPALAPAYDLLSTIPYIPQDGLALKLSRTQNMKGIGLDHFRQLVKKAAVPEHMVLQTVRETVDATRTAWTEQCRHYDLPNEIRMSIQKHMDDVLLSL